jgi:pimeloyl-ACP methyl ester carboxylesterase
VVSQTAFAEVNGARLYYETAGAGQPLVFVHAGLADSGMWDDQFQFFADHFRVLRYDMRGFGQSQPVAGEYSHADDLMCLMQYLDVAKANLIGCSQGGAVILDFALERPAMASALVAVSSSPQGLELDMPASSQFTELQAAILSNDWARFLELSAQIWFDGEGRTPDQVDREARNRLLAMYHRRLQLSRVDRAQEKPPLQPSAASRVAELHLPTSILYDARDLAVVRAASTYLA